MTAAELLAQIDRSRANVEQLRKLYPGCFDVDGLAIVARAALLTPKSNSQENL